MKYYPDADALMIKILDEKPNYGEPAGDETVLHYAKGGKLAQIEILDASKTIPVLSEKPLLKDEARSL